MKDGYECRYKVIARFRAKPVVTRMIINKSTVYQFLRMCNRDGGGTTWEIKDQDTGAVVKGEFPWTLRKSEPALNSRSRQLSLQLSDISPTKS